MRCLWHRLLHKFDFLLPGHVQTLKEIQEDEERARRSEARQQQTQQQQQPDQAQGGFSLRYVTDLHGLQRLICTELKQICLVVRERFQGLMCLSLAATYLTALAFQPLRFSPTRGQVHDQPKLWGLDPGQREDFNGSNADDAVKCMCTKHFHHDAKYCTFASYGHAVCSTPLQ